MANHEFCTPKKPPQHLLNKIKIPASPYMKKIGYGTGIAVYELERSPAYNKLRSPWAIKKLLKRNRDNGQIKSRLKQEADTLRNLVHPNIVGFRAFFEVKNVLAMEECTGCLGDLIEQRFDQETGPFGPQTITKVALDVAQALSYLHNTALIMHCDLKSYNVLIKGDFVMCKLCDFGVCLPVDKSGAVDKEKAPGAEYVGTRPWSAPEVLGHPQDISVKADIYSYGLIIWEMIALCPPLIEDVMEDISTCTELDLDKLDDLMERMGCRQRPPIPENVDLGENYNQVLEIYFCCTEEQKDKRPDATDLIGLLQELK
ncbi:lymphokine-activated killer T-cell-originated protein kinase homolog [Anthonomus grandis grandis]|uniref:lymphokine-activated killer T-cell-originated protein kinase homolog n=1 Tax=Anthonomus grandis grandis TaxID=2921223 RepID=UPI002165A0EB|nr:lymphokine-activated killer T-cell-originated protein kinase homolog [Anthonomus grandis grandis]